VFVNVCGRLRLQAVARQLSGVAAADVEAWYEACHGVIDLVAQVEAPSDDERTSPGDADAAPASSLTDEMRALQVVHWLHIVVPHRWFLSLRSQPLAAPPKLHHRPLPRTQ
jgi:hypothetical protein